MKAVKALKPIVLVGAAHPIPPIDADPDRLDLIVASRPMALEHDLPYALALDAVRALDH